ncbi:MAG: bacterioferritin-associated ferredoxin [Pseudomonas sp.]
MYVCLCQGITDSHIRTAINEGCCSYRDVRMTLGVASQCGKCACVAKQVVRETLSDIHSSQLSSAYPAHFVAA